MGEKQYSCNICNKKFSTYGDCNTHKTRNHFSAQENIKCQFCNEEVRKHSFKQHVKFKHQSSTLDIQKCDKGFGSKDRLKNHKKTHDNHKQFVCSVCKKGYNQRVHLKTHMMSHTGEKPYKCLYCEKSFINLQKKTNLHKKAKHETNRNKYKGENCQGTFNRPVDKKHKIICDKLIYSGTLITCKICQKDQTKYTILSHSKCHLTDAEMYKCEFCDKSFVKKLSKTRHEDNIHRKLNKVVCKICDKDFAKKNGLENHIKTTHQDREFKCKICPSSFIAESKLTIHKEYHNMKGYSAAEYALEIFQERDNEASHQNTP